MMSESPFWDDIRLANHWYEEGCCFKENCTPPLELFNKNQIISWLFEHTS
jgi:biotin synthase-related radical SAM superfamily protein